MSHPPATTSISRVLADLARLVLAVVDGRAAVVVAGGQDRGRLGWAPDEATEMTWLVGAGGSRRALGDLPDVLTVRAVGGQGDEAPDPDAVDTLAEFDRRVALVGSTSYVVAPVQTGDVSTDPSFVLVVRDDERSWTPLELASIRTVAEIARVSIRSCGAI